MKILFTADIHIKLTQKGVPVDWALNRYSLLIKELKKYQDDCDMVIIGGDVFDKLPNMEELAVYFDLVLAMDKPTLIYPGNHEATKKGKTFFTSLAYATHRLNNEVYVIDDIYTDTEAGFDIIPYNKLKEFNPDDFSQPILFTHVRGEIPPHVKPEIDLSLFDRWKTVLAGDLHSYENCQRNILYPGSPVTTSFHRSEVDTGIIIFDTETHDHEWIKLNLPQLIRKTIQAGETAERTDFHHTLYDVEGDMSQLSDMQVSDIVDRRVVKRSTETSLILDPTMSIEMEVTEYLRFILNLNDDAIENVLMEFNNTKHLC